MQSLFNVGQISLENETLAWQIRKFFSLPLAVGFEIKSPEFELEGSNATLNIWPCGRRGPNAEFWFEICLHKHYSSGVGRPIQFSLETKKQQITSCVVECSEHGVYRVEKFMPWSHFYAHRHEIAPDGCLMITGRILDKTVYDQEEFMGGKSSQWKKNDYEPVNKSSTYRAQGGDVDGAVSIVTPHLSYNGHRAFESDVSVFPCPAHESSVNSFFTTTGNMEHKKLTEESTLSEGDHVYSFKMPAVSAELDSMRKKPEQTCSNFDRSFTWVSQRHNPKLPEGCCASKSGDTLSSKNGSVSSDQSETVSKTESIYLKGLETLSDQFKQTYLDGKIFDLTIEMEGRQFRVLKGILCSRSPTFAELFSKNPDDDNCKVMSLDPIDACNSEVFHDFLTYIYSGNVENLSFENVDGLCCAADVYKQPVLKEMCIEFLKRSLSIQTVSNVLCVAEKHHDIQLQDLATRFLARNLENVIESEEWQEFTKENARLASQFQLRALKIGFTKII